MVTVAEDSNRASAPSFTLCLKGRTLSANMQWRTTKTGRTYKTKEGKDYERYVHGIAIEHAAKTKWRMPYYAHVDVVLYNQDVDRENGVKILMDGLEKVVFYTDRRVLNGAIKLCKDDLPPRIVITAYPISRELAKTAHGYTGEAKSYIPLDPIDQRLPGGKYYPKPRKKRLPAKKVHNGKQKATPQKRVLR